MPSHRCALTLWPCCLPCSGSAALEYKYVVRSERDMEAVRWMEGSNLQLRLPAQPSRLRVRDTWDESCREVEVRAAAAAEGCTGRAGRPGRSRRQHCKPATMRGVFLQVAAATAAASRRHAQAGP